MSLKRRSLLCLKVCENYLDVIFIYSQVSTAETNLKKHKYTNKRRDDSTKPSPRKRKKVVKKTSESGKIHTRHQDEITDCSSNDRVTSTTSPTLAEQGTVHVHKDLHKYRYFWGSQHRSKSKVKLILFNTFTCSASVLWEAWWPNGYWAGLWMSHPGLSLGQGTVLCSWERHFTLKVPLFTQVYKWVPINLVLGVILRWTGFPSRGGGGG